MILGRYDTYEYILWDVYDMVNSTESTTSPKFTKSRNSDSSIQIQIRPKSQFEFVPRDTEKSEFLDLVDFGDVAFSVQTVICVCVFCGAFMMNLCVLVGAFMYVFVLNDMCEDNILSVDPYM